MNHSQEERLKMYSFVPCTKMNGKVGKSKNGKSKVGIINNPTSDQVKTKGKSGAVVQVGSRSTENATWTILEKVSLCEKSELSHWNFCNGGS